MFAVGVDIGGTHIKSAVVDLSTGEIDKSTVSSLSLDNKASPEIIFHHWAECINQTLNVFKKGEVTGVGIAMPGPFNYKDGIALFKGNDKYERLYGLNVIEHLTPLLNFSGGRELRFHNDASCFAIGEDAYGNGKAYNKFISITLGTGFGSAFLESGVPVVDRADVPESGCLWYLPFQDDIADAYFSTRWFINEYQKRTGVEVKGVKDLVVQAEKDPTIKELFFDFGEALGQFLGPWITKFKAEAVVMGGNISKAQALFTEGLKQAQVANELEVPFVQCLLHEDAAIIGSARLIDDSYYNSVKDFLPTK